MAVGFLDLVFDFFFCLFLLGSFPYFSSSFSSVSLLGGWAFSPFFIFPFVLWILDFF